VIAAAATVVAATADDAEDDDRPICNYRPRAVEAHFKKPRFFSFLKKT